MTVAADHAELLCRLAEIDSEAALALVAESAIAAGRRDVEFELAELEHDQAVLRRFIATMTPDRPLAPREPG